MGKKGKDNHRYGIPLSEETKKRISESTKGKKRSEEGKRNISIAQKKRFEGKHGFFYGKKHTEETKRKMSEKKKGWKITPEMRKKWSEVKMGERNSQWRGGLSFIEYPRDFNNELRKTIRERDGYICQECGIDQNNLNRKLHIHHNDYDKKNNDEKNLISLCINCHMKTNFNREDWEKYFLNKNKR